MAPRSTKRRSPGEGGAYSYRVRTRADASDSNERWRVKGLVRQPDGTVKEVNKRGFMTKTEALEWLAKAQVDGREGTYIEPSKQQFGAYGAEVIDGLRIKPQTRASYVKNWRNHIAPYPIAQVPLAKLTGLALTKHYRVLEKSGRKDHKAGEGLSPRTVRYIHTIIHGVLGQAVKDGLLLRNPADAATPPSAREAKAPEMHPWNATQLAAFLGWAREHAPTGYPLWHLLAYTGMRRGEALSLRWRDVDLDTGTVSVRRSAGIVRYAGEGAEMVEDDTKSGKPLVIDIDPGTVEVLRAWRKERGSLALALAKPTALVFGDLEDDHRNGEHVWRQFKRDVTRCRKALGEDAVPVVRLHDLRHTHATLLLLAREPVHVVSQRLGHASPVVTMTIYAHVLPGNQRETANVFARLIESAA
jgi:integrase